MKTKHLKLAAVLATFLGLVATTSAYAAHFAAPTGVVCTNDGTDVTVSWDDIGADHYGGDFIATYPDGTVIEFDFSVKGEDVNEFTTALSTFDVDTDGDTVPDTPDTLEVTVKGLHPGKNQGPQNSAKSDPTDCGI